MSSYKFSIMHTEFDIINIPTETSRKTVDDLKKLILNLIEQDFEYFKDIRVFYFDNLIETFQYIVHNE